MFECEYCDSRFETNTALGGHVTAKHSDVEQCKYCGKKFLPANINDHLKACKQNPDNFTECNRDECDEEYFGSNPYCSKSCAARVNNKKFPKRKSGRKLPKCKNCGSEVSSYENQYCSNACQMEWRRKEKFRAIEGGTAEFPSDNTEANWKKKYLLHKTGESCDECGWDEVNPKLERVPLELHHIDGNAANNDLSNLKLLCPNCHSLTDTYMALNLGNGRNTRYD